MAQNESNTDDYRERIRARLETHLLGMQLAEVEVIRRDPAKHKLTLLMDGPLRYRFWRAGKDGRDRQVRYCYSTGRNVAGYYLSWREVVGKRGGKRDQWAARKLRKAASELARKRAEAWKAKRAAGEQP